jgi:HSP20 family protein
MQLEMLACPFMELDFSQCCGGAPVQLMRIQSTRRFHMEMKSLIPSMFAGSERDPFRTLQRQVDQLFSDFSRDIPGTGWNRSGSFGLAVDVVEGGKDITVTTDLPGVEEKDISVTLSGGMLTIKAEKKSEKDEKGKDYRLSERSFGMFERSMELPFKADASKVDAKFEKGVLKVTVAKPAEVQLLTHKIPVKAAA